MIRIVLGPVLLCAFALAAPSSANFVAEPKFDELMNGSDLVLIGTATATHESRKDFTSTATFSVSHRLKGESADTITVHTDSRIAELATGCCEKGASYLMFLMRSQADGGLHSVRGRYGMIRVGGPGRPVVAIPCRDSSRRGKSADRGRRADC